MSRKFISMGLIVAAMSTAQWAHAETPNQILDMLKKDAAGAQFSATRGENFFKVKHGGDWSCSSCHTDNLMNEGKHAKTEKLIKPLAPAANPERFTDVAKVEKWFKRNCKDVLERECTPEEKGDVLSYILSVGVKPVEVPKPVVTAPKPVVEAPKSAVGATHTAHHHQHN